MCLKVSTRVVPIVRLTTHALVPAALPSTIGNLKALKDLDVGNNALSGTCFCTSTNRVSDPADTVACSVARLDWAASGARDVVRKPEQHCQCVSL